MYRSFRAALAILLVGCGLQASYAQGHEEWSRNLGMYEVNVRQYTPEGTFDAFAEHLDRLEELGVGILWFMPIHPIGRQNRLGSLGSYYSVRDYLDVNPEFGTLEDFRELVDAAHERGMYVLIDWVANHTSWDNVLTTEHPEWYVTNSSGQFIPPPGTNWSDVIELDYSKSDLREWMIDALLFWIEDVGVDGFRFDAVDYVPDDFWMQANSALLAARPDVLLLAEGADPKYHAFGFHMTFGWPMYGFEGGALKEIADGRFAPAAFLWGVVAEEHGAVGDAYRLYFTSNHDENSWSGTPRELFGEAAEAFAVLTGTFRGMPLIYSGQEAGLNERLAFFDKDQIPWRDHPNTALYRTLLQLKRDNRAIWNGGHGGALTRIPNSNTANVFSFLREKEGDRVVGVFNLTDEPQTATLTGSAHAGNYHDPFTGASHTLEEGETLELGPWEYLIHSSVEIGTQIEKPVETGFRLEQNYPNPFSSDTTIPFVLDAAAHVRLTLYDVLGREVQQWNSGFTPAGISEVQLSAANLPAGTYFYRLIAGDQAETRRLLVVR